MKMKKNIKSMCKNNVGKKNVLLLGEGGERQKNLMSLSKISPDSCMIIYYIVEENIFVVFVYTLLSQTKDSFKTNGKQTIKMPRNM